MNADRVREEWCSRSGAYSPAYYAYHGANETSRLLRESLDAAVGPEGAVLEVGCSVGRHLAHLREHGYHDLWGIEVNDAARTAMEESYPDLAAAGTFRFAPVEEAITEFEDGHFDAVYSVETLQHIHEDSEWVFGELARVADETLITVEREREETGVTYVDDEFPLYYRDWRAIFTGHGLVEAEVVPAGRDTLRRFRA